MFLKNWASEVGLSDSQEVDGEISALHLRLLCFPPFLIKFTFAKNDVKQEQRRKETFVV